MKLPITLKFDDFYNLTETMFESNPLIEIGTTQGVIRSSSDLDIEDSMLCHNLFSKGCTITSIEVRPISFSIGDTVMIVDTGDIGEIIMGPDNQGLYGINDNQDRVWFSHNDKLVKIPSDLLHKLQD